MKKIFIIAPHFPPSALPPSQRVRLLVKHMKSLGWYPHVFTTNEKYREEQHDDWMTELAGNDFDLTIVKALNQRKTRCFGIGDLGLRMIPYLFPTLKKAAKKEKPSFFLYPVPPWYILLIAPLLKRKTKIPYGIDFIDPWFIGDIPKNAGFKKRISQKIAHKFEQKAVVNADIIYSVSEGINENLKFRYSLKENIPFLAIPYGVEISDYDNIELKKNDSIIIRHIGAVAPDTYPVIEPIFKALSNIANYTPIKIELIGTSYAGEKFAKPQTTKWIKEFHMENYMTESPLRVSYKEAVRLTMNSDILILFGNMQPYYAASKLMGLVASGKPFFAFLHKDSFPAKFLKNFNYRFLVEYSQTQLPETKINELKTVIKNIILEKDNFIRFDMCNPLIQQYTALGMTYSFLEPINELIKEKNLIP